MINSARIKKQAQKLGADLCGIASAERFKDAPSGFHPHDILADTQAVIVLAKRLPASALQSKSRVPYSFADDIVLHDVYRITIDLVNWLNDAGSVAIPIPSEPYEYWDEEKSEGRGILSLKHAGYLAGLGVLGKNTLLNNERFGDMLTLGAVLVNRKLAADNMADYRFCNEKCGLCIQNCPVQALDGVTVNQKLCRGNSQVVTNKGYSLYNCSRCRTICPHQRGVMV